MSVGRGSISARRRPSVDADPIQELRALPDATYLRSGDRWIRFANEDSALDNGIRFPSGQNALLGTIGLVLGVLDHADPGTVRATGEAVSHGDPVTVVTAEVDLLEAFREAAEIVDETVARSLFDDIESEVTVWLDEQGRARLVRLHDNDETMEIELWDFGVGVDVEAPAEYTDGQDPVIPDGGGTRLERVIDADQLQEFCVARKRLDLPATVADPRGSVRRLVRVARPDAPAPDAGSGRDRVTHRPIDRDLRVHQPCAGRRCDDRRARRRRRTHPRWAARLADAPCHRGVRPAHP